MSTASILLLGAIAGLTIFLGLPVGRMRDASAALRVFLNATATGVLLFLFWDVLSLAMDNVEPRLTAAHDGHASWGPFVGYAALFAGGLVVGLMALVYYDAWMKRRAHRPMGPGAASGCVPSRAGWRSSSRWASACTTSPRGWRSASPRPPATSSSRCC